LKGLFIVLGSGIPGVGVPPFGATATWLAGGIPGVEFADGGSGLADKPGGMLFASTVTVVLEFAAVLAFGAEVPVHAETRADEQSKPIKILEDIYKNLVIRII
jgi:hypothetical protein